MRQQGGVGRAYEQHCVDGTRDSLIAFYCLCYVPGPVFPPVLSLQGWSSVSNTISAKDLRGLMREVIPTCCAGREDPLRAPLSTMHLASLYRYPVKGLTPEPLERATLVAGETLPCDRAWAIENGPGRFDPTQPRHLPKINFLMLMRDERLATLRSNFEGATETLTILRDGKQVARGKLTTPLGRRLIEQFIAAYMKAELRGPPKIVHAEGHSFSDVAAKCVHIVNLASVRELGRTLGRPVDPLRFRANLYLDGLAPWAEFGWIDREIGLGNSTLGVFARTTRCEATNVDPVRGVRDMALPAHLQRTWGHGDFGIYAKVVTSGEVAVGSPVMLPR